MYQILIIMKWVFLNNLNIFPYKVLCKLIIDFAWAQDINIP